MPLLSYAPFWKKIPKNRAIQNDRRRFRMNMIFLFVYIETKFLISFLGQAMSKIKNTGISSLYLA